MKQQKTLTQLWLVSLFRGALSNLWDYLTLALCSAVLMSLFYYVFSDLLTKQLSGLPQLKSLSLGFGILVGTMTQFRLLFISRQIHDLSRFGQFVNAELGEIQVLNRWRLVLWRLLGPGVIWAVISTLPHWDLYLIISLFLTNLAVYKIAVTLLQTRVKPPKKMPRFLLRFPPILRWRVVRLLVYNDSCRALLALGFLLPVLAWLTRSTHLGFLWLVCLASGLLGGIAHIIVAAEDLRSSWLEKNAGLSHESFQETQIKISILIAFFVFIPSLALALLSPLPWEQRYSLILTGQAVSVMVPGILLQIDGKRAEISSVVLVLLGLFVGTAVLAHPLSFLLSILVVGYGLSSQSDRYYKQ
jgi:hypothetical protein